MTHNCIFHSTWEIKLICSTFLKNLIYSSYLLQREIYNKDYCFYWEMILGTQFAITTTMPKKQKKKAVKHNFGDKLFLSVYNINFFKKAFILTMD